MSDFEDSSVRWAVYNYILESTNCGHVDQYTFYCHACQDNHGNREVLFIQQKRGESCKGCPIAMFCMITPMNDHFGLTREKCKCADVISILW